MYKAEILADSLSPQGDRLTTMKITFPRFILAEMNTHRMFSRNSASSRAIPFKKMVQMVQDNPFIPIAWQKDHKGMQGTEYFNDELSIQFARSNWLTSRDNAIKGAMSLHSTDNGYGSVTKQLCNRLLEPFMWHEVIVTATEWENFFNLRCPFYLIDGKTFRSKKDVLKYTNEVLGESDYDGYTDLDWLQINKSQADIHIQAIAELMWDAMKESTPKQLQEGEWHIPFGDKFDLNEITNIMEYHNSVLSLIDYKLFIATARCARISYQTLGDDPKIDYEADIKLHDRLIKEGHMSPFEHCARVMSAAEYFTYHNGSVNGEFDSETEIGSFFTISQEHKFLKDKRNGWCRNFKGFIQYRHMVENK